MHMEQNTKHAARATQVEQQVEKKTYTHDTDSGNGLRGVSCQWSEGSVMSMTLPSYKNPSRMFSTS